MLDWLINRKKTMAAPNAAEVKRLSLEGIKLYRDDQLIDIRQSVCDAVANTLRGSPAGAFEGRASGCLKQGSVRYANYLLLFSCPADEDQAGTALVEIELVPSHQKAQFFMFIESRRAAHLTHEVLPSDQALIYTERIRQALKTLSGGELPKMIQYRTDPGLTKIADASGNVVQFRPK